MNAIDIRPVKASDRDWIEELLIEQTGGITNIVHGETFHPTDLPGFVALQDGEPCGLVTYIIRGKQCEIVTIHAFRPGTGAGSKLLESVKREAVSAGCSRLFLVTTNDNLNALAFYQKRGFRLTALRAGAVDISRKTKPEIPLVNENGIPIRDELELEMDL
jgi:ribosomal protein S18 acetylase RimI-like enzyme